MTVAHINRIATAVPGYDIHIPFVRFARSMVDDDPRSAALFQDMVDQLSTWLKSGVDAPDVKAKLVQFQLFPRVVCGPAFAAHLRKAHDDYAEIIREANIKAE